MVERKLRLGSKEKTAAEKQRETKKSGARTVGDMLKEGSDVLITSLEEAEVSLLIDYGALLDAEVKMKSKEVTLVKDILKAVAENKGWKQKEGERGLAKIGASSRGGGIDAVDFAKLLKKEGKTDMFPSLVSVKLTDAKKYLGEDVLKSIEGEKEVIEYGSISLKLIR